MSINLFSFRLVFWLFLLPAFLGILGIPETSVWFSLNFLFAQKRPNTHSCFGGKSLSPVNGPDPAGCGNDGLEQQQ